MGLCEEDQWVCVRKISGFVLEKISGFVLDKISGFV